MSESHVNKLCRVCVNNCKQSDSARIVECPNFIKMPTDSEFRRMVDDLDAAEVKARTIRTRARELIQDALAAADGDDAGLDDENNGADTSTGDEDSRTESGEPETT